MARQLVARPRQILITKPRRRRGSHAAVSNRMEWCVITRYRSLLAVAIAVFVSASAIAAPPVRTLFADATAKEQAVRAAFGDPAVTTAVLKSVRQTVTSYELVVRRFPTSGYSDDALWQAAHLALDAFGKFGDVQDRETGLRLLRWLTAEYPTSKLARQAPDLIAATEGAAKDVGKASSRHAVPNTPKAKANAAPIAAPKMASLTNIQRSLLPDVVRVTIALDAEVPFHDERIAGPSRIFIDFPTTRATASLSDQTLRFDEDSDLVRQVRIGRQPNTTTRVVLDADGISSYSVYPVYNPYRLVIDCVRTTPTTLARATPVTAKGAATVSAVRLKPDTTPEPPRTKADAGIDATRTNPNVSVEAGRTTARSIVEGPRAKPLAAVAPVRPNVPIVARRIVMTWAGALPSVGPNATAILDAARVPPILSTRPLANIWSRSLPNTSPGATTAILSAARLAAPLGSRRLVNTLDRGLPKGSPAATAAIADALTVPAPEPAPVLTVLLPTPAPLPAEPPVPVPGLGTGFSMARQLGLGVSRIVIDPGHGGHDPGAKGKGGITEAELVLDVSLRLEKLLAKVPGVEVLLTRHSDEFVALPERTAMANREGADVFLSIHANASPNDQAHGVETYFLNFANNLSAAAVAARENATSGQAMGALPDFVRAIALNNKLDESRDFAMLVQQSMVERLGAANNSVKNLGVKQAPFVVLIGASMPSVLAEISFLTHEQEAKLLKSSAYRQRIAEALFDAVRQYQGSLKRVQTVAHQ